MNDAPHGQVLKDIKLGFPCRHGRAHGPNSVSRSDGSAKKVDGSPKGNRTEQDLEAAGTCTGTGLITAHSQDELRIEPHHEYNQLG